MTVAGAEIISRVNPYYLLVGGRPLPIVILEESAEGRVVRAWFSRWLRASTKEQIDFCGAMLFWSPPDDFGPIPDWLAEAQRLEDAKDAEKASDLARCQQSIAHLRSAMLAASASLNRQGDHALATLLFDATGNDDRARAARRALEEDAGYIAGTREGECYP